MNKNVMIISISVISMLVMGCKTANLGPSEKDTMTAKKLNSIFSALNTTENFNGTVLIAKNDKIVYENALGFLNGAKETKLKLNSRFNIGSIFKEIPAIAIMQLKEKNQLRLDDTLDMYLTDLPEWSKTVTVKNLLQYTSGLPKIAWGKYPIISDDILIQELNKISNLEFKSGQSYLYTNYSPFLLSKIVEKITKQGFAGYVITNILEPSNMENSEFEDSFPHSNNASVAVSFNKDYVEDAPPFTITASGFLFTTSTRDLFNYLNALHNNILLTKSSIQALGETANLKIQGMESPLGQISLSNGVVSKHIHHGSSGNYEGIISKNFNNGLTIIILTNQKNKNVYDILSSIETVLE